MLCKGNEWGRLLNYTLLHLFLSTGEGSGEPQLCPAGTFSLMPGLTSEAGCQPCAAGFYCRGSGLRAPTGPCSQGQTVHCFLNHWLYKTLMFLKVVCFLKVWVFDAFFVEATASFPSFNTLLYCVSSHSIGYWCPPGQTVATALPCPPGHFCPQGSAAPEPCPSGTYQDREKQGACNVCEAGGSHPHSFFYILSKGFYFFYIKKKTVI